MLGKIFLITLFTSFSLFAQDSIEEMDVALEQSLEKDFVAKKLHPADLKAAVAGEIITLLKPMKKDYDKKLKLAKEAYPK